MDTITAALVRTSHRTAVHVIKPADAGVNTVYISQSLARELLGSDFFTAALAKAKKGEALNTESFSKKVKIAYDFAEQKVSYNASNVACYMEGTDKKDSSQWSTEFLILVCVASLVRTPQ